MFHVPCWVGLGTWTLESQGALVVGTGWAKLKWQDFLYFSSSGEIYKGSWHKVQTEREKEGPADESACRRDSMT